MSILSGPEILRQMAFGSIKIEGTQAQPFDSKHIGPNSVDLHLGNVLRGYSVASHRVMIDAPRAIYKAIDSKNPPPLIDVAEREGGGWELLPYRLYLGSTLEHTETQGFVPYIDGRSSLGRLGVFAHATAGRGDDGFCGNWTLEISVVEPVILYPGERYFQITYHTIEGERSPYRGRYQGDREPIASRINR